MDTRHKAVVIVIQPSVAANPLIAGITCPTITPTVGPAELLTNPGFEGTYDTEAAGIDIAPDWNLSGLDTGTDTATKETTTIHGGSASQKFICDATAEGVVTAANCFPANGWYAVSFWVNKNGALVNGVDDNGFIDARQAGGNNTWEQATATGRVLVASKLYIRTTSGGTTAYVDDASVKALTDTIVSLGTLAGRSGTYTCHPTITDRTQAGMAVAYKDASNYVLAILYRTNVTVTAKLIKVISGTIATDVKSGTVTYSAGAELKVIVNGTTYQLFYNGTQVSTDATIADTLGEGVYGFSTSASNSVGTVTANL
jgi:hypothetical protein